MEKVGLQSAHQPSGVSLSLRSSSREAPNRASAHSRDEISRKAGRLEIHQTSWNPHTASPSAVAGEALSLFPSSYVDEDERGMERGAGPEIQVP